MPAPRGGPAPSNLLFVLRGVFRQAVAALVVSAALASPLVTILYGLITPFFWMQHGL